MQKTKNFRPTCYSCTAFVIDVDKAYCEEEYFDDIPVQKAKTYDPCLFECVEYERMPD